MFPIYDGIFITRRWTQFSHVQVYRTVSRNRNLTITSQRHRMSIMAPQTTGNSRVFLTYYGVGWSNIYINAKMDNRGPRGRGVSYKMYRTCGIHSYSTSYTVKTESHKIHIVSPEKNHKHLTLILNEHFRGPNFRKSKYDRIGLQGIVVVINLYIYIICVCSSTSNSVQRPVAA